MPQPLRLAQAPGGRVEATQHAQHRTTIDPCRRVGRRQCNRLLQGVIGILKLAHGLQRAHRSGRIGGDSGIQAVGLRLQLNLVR